MATENARSAAAWRLAERQHWVITHAQLLECGFTEGAIRHRRLKGRLHGLHRGVYAVGRATVDGLGRWMAAVLSCGPGALLSHSSAAALWGVAREDGRVEVSVEAPRSPRRPGLVVHRRARLGTVDLATCEHIPVTSPTRTLLDLGTRLSRTRLEAAVNEADKLGLVHPDRLRSDLDGHRGEPGVLALRELLDAGSFVLTDSELERRFLPIARRAGLPKPQTGVRVNGFRVDFFWPELGLVVETDGLRYHRTAAQQGKDRLRDQTHAAAGLTTLRFTFGQVAHEPAHVEATLRNVASHLRPA